jgi:signal transduction histidine kinase
MNALIWNFLDFARPLQIHPTSADLKALFDDVVKQQSELAKSREVKLIVRGLDASLAFTFDPDLLKLAIANLVQNAIQASAPGQEVELRAAEREEDVVVLVSDQGEGIQPQHLENIFNPFFTTKPEGVGLGLAIVSKIVDEHQGHVTVFSEPGRGTRFEITLPKVHQS